MMDATDPIIHAQMKHTVDSGRKAVAADRAVFLVQMFDDVKDATATMCTFSVIDEDAEPRAVIVEALLMLESGMNSLLSSESIRPGAKVEIKIVVPGGPSFSLTKLDYEEEFMSIEL